VGFSLIGAIFIMPAVLSLVGMFTQKREAKKAAQHPSPAVDSEL
jgi:hypothetical protein